MVTDKLVVILIKSTGNKYAYPASRWSELPVVRIENGEPRHTSLSRSDLVYMEDCGAAIRVGVATLGLNITYEENHPDKTSCPK